MAHNAQITYKDDFDHLPPPPVVPSWCAGEAPIIRTHFITQQRAHAWQIDYILRMLSEGYLCSLPTLRKDNREKSDSFPNHLWWLWYHWYARILSWTLKPTDSDPEEFAAEIRNAIHESMFISPK
jgi:hypothetical protein